MDDFDQIYDNIKRTKETKWLIHETIFSRIIGLGNDNQSPLKMHRDLLLQSHKKNTKSNVARSGYGKKLSSVKTRFFKNYSIDSRLTPLMERARFSQTT